MRQEHGSETASSGGVGDEREQYQVLPGLWQAARSGNVLQIIRAYHDGFGLLLAGIGGEPEEGKEDLGTSVKNLGKGGANPRVSGFFSRKWCIQYYFGGRIYG